MDQSTHKIHYSLHVRILLFVFVAIKKTGIFNTSFGKIIFLKLYFFYKRFLGDPFSNFIDLYPHIFKGKIVLDIGANCGYTASVFGRAVGANGHVYAFEPDINNFDLLK